MTLILNNDDVQSVITMEMTMNALEEAYQQLARSTAVCRPRVDIRIPTRDAEKTYQWGTMEGGSAEAGYFAIRMKSDIVYEQEYEGVRTQEKYCVQPGTFCGLILLINVQNGEPLALMNDGVLQHTRVGADSGIGVKYMAREDAQVVGMLGSGGMARSHAASFAVARNIRRIKVFSPTKEHREAYAREIAEEYGIDVEPVATPQEVFTGVDIVAGCTDSVRPVIMGDWLEPGTHVTCIGGGIDEAARARFDRSLRLGSAPAPTGLPELRLHDENISYEADPPPELLGVRAPIERVRGRSHGVIAEDRAVFLEELLNGTKEGRRTLEEVTYSARGNIQGAQFYAVAGKVYEAAKAKGLGHEIPTEWLLQDIRD